MDKHVIEVEARFTDNVTAGAKKADKALDSLEKKAKKSTSVKMNFNPNTTKLDKMLSKLDQFAGKAKSGFKVTVSVVDQATSRLNRISSAGARIAGKTWRATVKIADYATRPLRGILSALTSVQALIAGVATGAAVNYGVVKPVSLSDQIKQLNMAFSTQLGGDAAAQSFMNEIYAFDKKSPFDTMQIAQQAQLMLNTGWQRDEILPDLSNIGDWAAAMGKGEAGISSVVMALGQMRQKGRVYAEEMLQLTEAGVSGWEYLAQSLGVSTAQVREMVEDGAVSVDDAVRGIIGGMSEFAGTAERTANETISGMMDQIGTTLKMGVALPWGEGLSEGFGDGLQYLKDQLVDNEDQLTAFGEQARQIGIQIGSAFSDFAISGINKVRDILNDPEFQSLSLGGKLSFAWDELIAEPFSGWWNESGKQMVTDAGAKFAGWLWDGITGALGSFVSEHPLISTVLGAAGLSKLWQGLRGGSGAGGAGAVGTMTVTAGVVNVNGAGIGTGGSGLPGAAGVGAAGKAAGAGGVVSRLLSGLSTGGYLIGAAGVVDALGDLIHSIQTDGKESKDYGVKSGTKLGMVGAGAGLGAAIGSIVPGLGTAIGAGIGAGIGGLGALFGGDTAGQWISNQLDPSRAQNAASRAAESAGLARQTGSANYASNAANLATDALAYSVPSLALSTGNNIADAFQQGITGSMVNAMSAAAADPQITQSVTSMLNQLKPTTAQIEDIAAEFAAAGQAIPESLTDYLANIDFYTALSGGLGSLQEYLNSLSITAPVDTEIDPNLKINPVDPSAQIQAMLMARYTTAQTNVGVIPFYEYLDTDLDPSEMGDGWSVTANPNVSVVPFYSYSTGNFDSSALAPSSITKTIGVDLMPKYNLLTGGGTDGNQAAGGIVSKYGVYTLAEEGTPEAVIPLGAHRRDRGIELWKRAGNALGIPGFFNGGIAGDEDKAVGASQYVTPEVGGGDTDNSISISLGGVNIQVTGATGDVIEEIRARAAEAADIVAGEFIKVARVMAQNSPRRA